MKSTDAFGGPAVRAALIVLSAAYVLLFCWVALSRIGYPYELEWMGGAFLDHVCRVLDGKPIYVAPDTTFVPFLYAPLFFYLGAGVSLVTGEGFLPLRLVSILATLGTIALIFVLLRRRTGDTLPAIAGCGLYAACYGLVDTWYDTARADSLFVVWLMAALALVLLGDRRRTAILAAVALTIAYLSKQTAFLLAPSFCVAIAVADWRRALWFGGTFVVLWGATVAAIDLLHDGWFWFYTWELPRRHEYITEPLWSFWLEDLLYLYPSLLLGAWLLWTRSREGDWRGFLQLGAWWGGLMLAGCLSRMHVGGAENVLMPAYLGVSLTAALALAATRHASGWQRRAIPIVVVAQLAMLAFDPRPYIPTDEDRAVGDRLVQLLREADGEVVVPLHGYLPRLAGKQPTAHAMAVLDVVRTQEPGISAELERAFWDWVTEHEPAVIVLDDNLTEFVRLPERPEKGFDLIGLGYDSNMLDLVPKGDAFQPVVGLKSRPRYVFRRR